MKLIILAALALCSSAFGALDLPSKSFSIAELDKAKAMAAEKGKPLIFVET